MAKKNKFEVEAKEQTSSVVAMNYRDRVSEQYQTVCAKTGEFFREVVKFGALLNEVESFIGDGVQCRDGSGLKGWLAENCPDVNYNTAAGYKAMAAKCARMIGGGVQAIACLQGRDEVIEPATNDVVDVDESFIEKRNALFEEVDSRRKLEQMWFEFLKGQGGKRGRPHGVGETGKRVAKTADQQANEAAAYMDELCGHLTAFIFESPMIHMLTLEQLDSFASSLKTFKKKVDEIAAEK